MKKVQTFNANAIIVFNGRKIYLTGQGLVDDERGIVSGSYRYDAPANDFEPLILQTVLVTGYPSVCCTRKNGYNPFHGSDYSYTRNVNLQQHGQLSYQAKCWLTEGAQGYCLESTFDVSGELRLPPLKGALPLVERWAPAGNEILSSFEIVWPTHDGGKVKGNATTRYSPSPASRPIDSLTVRHIKFHRAAVADGRIEIIQESWLQS